MSFPFGPATKTFTFDGLIKPFRSIIQNLPDSRKGAVQTKYSMEDAALGAFSVFFTQSPSFLAFQRTMHDSKGLSNAQSLFEMEKVPSDNWIRKLLDDVPPSAIFPIFSYIFNGLKDTDKLEQFKNINGNLLMVLDGVYYHSSQKIHCDYCNEKPHKNGKITYSHSAITPVIVSPDSNTVISLEPEFITPQDRHNKPDCEPVAAKRWIRQYAHRYKKLGATILGDDLYSRQPLCEIILDEGLNFILVCKPQTHKTLYEWVTNLEAINHIKTVVVTRRHGKKVEMVEIDTYRFVNQVPLRDGDDALMVNWCELITTDKSDNVIFRRKFFGG